MQQPLARKRHWTLSDIPWQDFDPAKVDSEILKVVKAAAMVEHNGGDYGIYLCNIFQDDPEFQIVARGWAQEEVQHGQALAKWAERASSASPTATRYRSMPRRQFVARVPASWWHAASWRRAPARITPR
jgi:hypothetical protein